MKQLTHPSIHQTLLERKMAAPTTTSNNLLLLFFFFVAAAPVGLCSPTKLGVVFRDIPGKPGPVSVIPKFPASSITHVHLPDPSPKTVGAFQHTNIDLLVSIPNALIPALASNIDNARSWVAQHIKPFYPHAKVTHISVGVGVPVISQDLVTAVRHVGTACVNAGQGLSNIQVTTSLSFTSVLKDPFPPSGASFREPASLVTDLLKQLNNSTTILFEMYPYELLKMKPAPIPLKMALFDAGVYRYDQGSGIKYYNVFDEMIDAVVAAKKKVVGHAAAGTIKVSVSGTGWPTEGGMDATAWNAGKYDKGLLAHLKSATPMNLEGPDAVYITELFDNPMAPMPNWNRHYGIWDSTTLTSKFDEPAKKKNKNGAEGVPSAGFGMAVGFGVAVLLLFFFV